jgi:hypothetical protein
MTSMARGAFRSLAGFSLPFAAELLRNVVLGKLTAVVFPPSRGISLSEV